MKRKTNIWRGLLILVIILAVVAGGLLIYRNQTTLAQDTTAEPVQTTTVRRGDLVVSATGAGTVIPASEVELGFSSGGVLTEIAVQVGSKVAAGDVLARVDDTDARMQVNNAELNLTQAQLQLAKLKQEPSTAELAAAAGSLASAQATLESRLHPATTQEIAAAQQSLLSAQQKLADLLAGPSAEDSTAAEVDLKLAEITLQQAQSEYDKVIEQIKLKLANSKDLTVDELPFTLTTQDDIIETRGAATEAFRNLLAWVAGVSLIVPQAAETLTVAFQAVALRVDSQGVVCPSMGRREALPADRLTPRRAQLPWLSAWPRAATRARAS